MLHTLYLAHFNTNKAIITAEALTNLWIHRNVWKKEPNFNY